MTTTKQLSILELAILDGYIRLGSYAAVARELNLAKQTVKNHASRILEKLECVSIAQACVIYDRERRPR